MLNFVLRRMGKKDKTGVGRAVLKHRSKGGNLGKGKESWLHTSDLNDGEELNTKSVTEQSALDEFLTTAELAGTEFIAEKLNITVFNDDHTGGLPSKKDEQHIQEVQNQHRQLLQIPRRPKWDERTTPEQLDQLEKENFLAWRRGLAELQKKDDLILTPFERNLEFWRQLWRVIERSNVVVQIVDARNPLLFRCEDLENYVTEVNCRKVNVLLINKADYLTQQQRELWATYFKSINVKAVFWSAAFETERLKELKVFEEAESLSFQHEVAMEEQELVLTDSHVTQFLNLKEKSDNLATNNQALSIDTYDSDALERGVTDKDALNFLTDIPKSDLVNNSENFKKNMSENVDSVVETSEMDNGVNDGINLGEMDASVKDDETVIEIHYSLVTSSSDTGDNTSTLSEVCVAGKNVEFYTSGHLLTGEELLAYCRWLHQQYGKSISKSESESKESQTVIGLVGYPNVGKSSTINAILQAKKVPVSSTPGRTKHFQTLLVDRSICLCDCPGLVFPSFVSTKAEMVVSGILPIDQLRDHVPPVTLVCRRIPRSVLEAVYGINLRQPEEWEDPERPPHAEELLDAYSFNRGYITSQARADGPRSARYILKDYVNGKLLYCLPPPTVDAGDFQASFTTVVKSVKKKPQTCSKSEIKTHGNKMDSEFFKKENVRSHKSATTGTEQYRKLLEASRDDPNMVIVGKPWKKHGNKNKKEKLRRLQPNGY